MTKMIKTVRLSRDLSSGRMSYSIDFRKGLIQRRTEQALAEPLREALLSWARR